jgi:hypothetical protein
MWVHMGRTPSVSYGCVFMVIRSIHVVPCCACLCVRGLVFCISGGSTSQSDRGARQFVNVTDMASVPPLSANHPANRLTAVPTAEVIGDQLYAVTNWNAPPDLHDAGLAGGGPGARRAELTKAKQDLTSMNAALDELSAQAAELTRQFETPKEMLRQLEEQQRVAAIDRLLFHANTIEHDVSTTQGKQELITLLIQETERQLDFLQPKASGPQLPLDVCCRVLQMMNKGTKPTVVTHHGCLCIRKHVCLVDCRCTPCPGRTMRSLVPRLQCTTLNHSATLAVRVATVLGAVAMVAVWLHINQDTIKERGAR